MERQEQLVETKVSNRLEFPWLISKTDTPGIYPSTYKQNHDIRLVRAKHCLTVPQLQISGFRKKNISRGLRDTFNHTSVQIHREAALIFN